MFTAGFEGLNRMQISLYTKCLRVFLKKGYIECRSVYIPNVDGCGFEEGLNRMQISLYIKCLRLFLKKGYIHCRSFYMYTQC